MTSLTSSSTSRPDRRRQFMILGSAVLAGILAAFLYQRALGFTFFNDDPTGHFAWMEGRSLWDFFRNSAAYGYYRPVVFSTLRGMETFFGNPQVGTHNASADHGLLLALQAANTAMLWLLAYMLSGRLAAYAWATALFFITVPFNYEAVIYVASLTHPLLLFWLLLTLLLYIGGRDSGRRWLLAMALLTSTLALLTHENGLLVFPALAGVEWVQERPSTWRDWLRPVWPFAIPSLLFVPLWFSIPKEGEQTLSTLSAALSNAVPFLQTLVYPLLPAFNLQAGDLTSLVALTALTLGATVYLAYRSDALRLGFFAVGWIVLSALPAMLFLGPAYVYGSPRLSYLPSVGVALLWAIPVLWLWREPVMGHWLGQAARWLRPLAAAGYILLVTLPPLTFIRCQVDFYAEASRITENVVAATTQTPNDRDTVFVNLPFFFSSHAGQPDGCPSPYPWTPTGAVVIPPYAQVQDFVRFNSGPDRPVRGVTFEDYAPGWNTYGAPVDGAQLREYVTAGEVFVFDLFSDGLFNLSAAWQPMAKETPLALASFGNSMSLIAAEFEPSDEGITVQLNWRVEEIANIPLTTFVHLVAADGTLLAQDDAPPGNGFVPPALWQPGDLISSTHTLALENSPSGAVVLIGLYDSSTGERLTAIIDGERLTNDALRLGVSGDEK